MNRSSLIAVAIITLALPEFALAQSMPRIDKRQEKQDGSID